ncbi:hypothetical protein [Azospirillum argentinense]|uniref:hypothetical protein n=1 Tax=Azospirillum argentinense TaxID=2970906 RepID=UPI0032DEE8EA
MSGHQSFHRLNIVMISHSAVSGEWLGVPLLRLEPTEVALIRATTGIVVGDEAIAEWWLHFGRPSASTLRRFRCTPGTGATSGPHAPTRKQLKTYDVEPAQVTTETLRSYGAAFCR